MGYKRDIIKNERSIIEIDKIIKNMESCNPTVKKYNALKVKRDALKYEIETWNILVGRYLHIKQRRYSYGLGTYVMDDYYIHCKRVKRFLLYGDIIYFKTTDLETKKDAENDDFGFGCIPGYGAHSDSAMDFYPYNCTIRDISKEKFDNKMKYFTIKEKL